MSDSQTPLTPRNRSRLRAKLEQAKASPDLCDLVELDRNVDYNKKLCSIARLREMMDLIGVDHQKLRRKPLKNATVQHYRTHAAPVIDDVLLHPQLNRISSLSSSSSTTPTSNIDTAMNKPSTSMVESSSKQPPFKTTTPASSKLTPTSSQSTPTSSVKSMQTTSHVSTSESKVNELRQGLKKSVGKMVSSGFNKRALLKLERHISNLRNNSPNPSIQLGQLFRPDILSLEEIKKQDRDTIRQALQAHCPQLWIPINVAVSRHMLVALYNMFLLDKEEPQLCQGVHFDIFPIEEINIDGYIDFGVENRES
ncbi:hypothetical protein DFH28DRAFT_1124792 [Melampsora americana]|nr:hypothetical protein DFH28DRAFT_1124792 [Melampsora americana]